MIAYLSTTGGLCRCLIISKWSHGFVVSTKEPVVEAEVVGITLTAEDGTEMTARCEVTATSIFDGAPRVVASERVVH